MGAFPRKLALDTNVLLILVALPKLWDRRYPEDKILEAINAIRGTEDYLSMAAYDCLWNVFERATLRLVTVAIVAEVDNKLRRCLNTVASGEYEQRKLLERFLRDWGIKIEPVAPEGFRDDAFRHVFLTVGYADASLIFAAKRQGCAVVSDDQRLSEQCGPQDVPCYSLSRLSESANDS